MPGVGVDAVPQVSKRRLPASGLEVSSLTFALDPPASPHPEADALTVRSLQKARDHGVISFDLSAARHPLRAQLLVAEAFPGPDPSLVIFVGGGSGFPRTARGEAAPSGAALPDGGRASVSSLEESVDRMGLKRPPVLLWRTDPRAQGVPDDIPDVLAELISRGLIADWGIELDREAGLPALRPAVDPPALYAGPLSLLDRRLLPSLEERAATAKLGYLVRDPYAGGRLDGSRFAGSVGDRSPRASPTRLRDLEADFGPILPLAFLTAGRRRTLSEAALLFAFRFPWVSTISVPLPPPERLESTLRAERASPLGVDELARLGTL